MSDYRTNSALLTRIIALEKSVKNLSETVEHLDSIRQSIHEGALKDLEEIENGKSIFDD